MLVRVAAIASAVVEIQGTSRWELYLYWLWRRGKEWVQYTRWRIGDREILGLARLGVTKWMVRGRLEDE